MEKKLKQEQSYTDLHLHLDGSLPYDTVVKLAKMQGILLPGQDGDYIDENVLRKALTVSDNCRDLNEYLEKFALPLSLMQTEEAISVAVADLGESLTKCNVEYAELRFAPQLHTRNGLTQEDVIRAAIKGADSVNDTRIRIILCLMRGKDNHNLNLETVKAAKLFRDNSVFAGLDLAGAEGLYPTKDFSKEFELARMFNLPFTIHAGEAAGPESIWEALSFGAKRIGHGIHAVEDEKLMDYLRDKRIVIEVCPTSNIQTKAVLDIKNHPVRQFLQHGICVTVNTDNMTVSGTTISEEFKLLEKELGLTAEEKEKLMRNAKESHL